MSGRNPPPGGGADDSPQFDAWRPSSDDDAGPGRRAGWRRNRIPGRHREGRQSSAPPPVPTDDTDSADSPWRDDDPPGGSDQGRRRGIPPAPGEFAAATRASDTGGFPRPPGDFGSDTGGFRAVPPPVDTGGFAAAPSGAGRPRGGSWSGADAGAESPPASGSDDGLDLYQPDRRVPDPYAEQTVEPSPYDLLPANTGPAPRRVPVPQQSNPTFWTGLLVGVFTLCVLAGVGVYYFFGPFDEPPKRQIVRAPVAGGLQLDTEAASVYSRLLDPYRQLLQDISGNRIGANVVTGVYNAGFDPESGQRQQVLFVGSVGDLGNPRDLASDFRELEKKRKNLKVTRVDPGPAGGEAFCLELRLRQSIGNTAAGCVWLTENSVGYIIPTSPAKAADVAITMRKMRPDLEKVRDQ